MTRAPTYPLLQDSADEQIGSAAQRLVDLLVRQAAREFMADAPKTMEIPDATPPHKDD
jgi:hypothetical protein